MKFQHKRKQWSAEDKTSLLKGKQFLMYYQTAFRSETTIVNREAVEILQLTVNSGLTVDASCFTSHFNNKISFCFF